MTIELFLMVHAHVVNNNTCIGRGELTMKKIIPLLWRRGDSILGHLLILLMKVTIHT